MAQTSAANSPSPALIFIPDITGFTQFVSDTEINHARHIIQELLNILLESNKLDLEVSEVEGDAILFYRFGAAPTSAQLMDQVKKMFIDFHQHVQKYDTHRICNCGACRTASRLTVKFIAHYGEVAINQVQNFKKLFGIDVITAHRLLKNDIDKHEYLLLTENLISKTRDWSEQSGRAWAEVKSSSQLYDSGKVNYSFVHLDPLYASIPELKVEDFRLKGHTVSILKTEAIIEAPMELVFDVLTDVTWRGKWIPGTLPETTNVNSYFSQNGQSHRCMANGPVMFLHDFRQEKDKVFLTETADSKSHSCVYTITRLDDNRTLLNNEFFMSKNFFKQVMFRLLMKKKFEKVCLASWANLNAYCKSLVDNKQKHPYNIVLKSTPVPVMAVA